MELTTLTALTLLTASGIGDIAIPALAKLTGLRHLDIERPEKLTLGGLLQLTTLVGLTQLLVQSAPTVSSRMPSTLNYNRAIYLRSRPVSGWLVAQEGFWDHRRRRMAVHVHAFGLLLQGSDCHCIGPGLR